VTAMPCSELAAVRSRPGRATPARPIRIMTAVSRPGILQRTIRRDRDPAWPSVDRIALDLRCGQLRRRYVGEMFAGLRHAVNALLTQRR
jgi:hypothetical protein